jgi:hypothetical protein
MVRAKFLMGHFLPRHLTDDATAMPPKAATAGGRYRGREGPKPDVSNRSKIVGLFDDLVGSPEQWQRNSQSERLGGLEVDDELDLRRLLDR